MFVKRLVLLATAAASFASALPIKPECVTPDPNFVGSTKNGGNPFNQKDDIVARYDTRVDPIALRTCVSS